jgi:hypothetical protein
VQNKANWWAGGPRLRIGDCGLKDAGCGRAPEGKCAKRTQFPAGPGGPRSQRRGPIMQNKPNFGQRRKKSGGDAQPPIRSGAGSTKSRGVQNEPNSARPAGVPRRNVQNEPNLARPQAADGGNCAKRSQTWGNWGMWTKAVVVWGVARPGGETCKTNPIWHARRGMGAGSPGRAAPAESDCAKRGQFARPKPAQARVAGSSGLSCKTKPICHRANVR